MGNSGIEGKASANGMGDDAERGRRLRNLIGIRDAVSRRYDSLDGEPYSFLGGLREQAKAHRPRLLEILDRILIRYAFEGSVDPWTTFDATEGPLRSFPEDSRHRTIALERAPGPGRPLSIALVHGSFDPFHLGHLYMGLECVAEGSSDFVIYMPNADHWHSTSPLKPGKNDYAWRARTVFAGGVDDFYPISRLSPLGKRGTTPWEICSLLERNAELIDGSEGIVLTIVIGGDVTSRPDFAERTNEMYGRVASFRGGGAVRLRFRIVERESGGSGALAEAASGLAFPFEIARSVSSAASSEIRRAECYSENLYPGSLALLEPLFRYRAQPG
jgi:hypothetical protein